MTGDEGYWPVIGLLSLCILVSYLFAKVLIPLFRKIPKTLETRHPTKFSTLLSLSGFFIAIGWIIVFISLLVVLAGVGAIATGIGLTLILAGSANGMMGLLLVAVGQLTRVFLAIEENTRKIEEHITETLSSIDVNIKKIEENTRKLAP